MPTAAIAGTGLIGTSIGCGLVVAGWDITGWDPEPATLETAQRMGGITARAASFEEMVAAGADVVVLAGPPRAIIEQLGTIRTADLVIDVAGVKGPIVAAGRGLARFVGTHPMAGREVSGAGAASAALFRGAAWVVVTDGATAADLLSVESIVTTLGARPVRLSAAEHDAAVAKVSHVPQVLAATLLDDVADDPAAIDLASGSFRDLTRVAASDPRLWVEVLAANKVDVAAALRALAASLATTAQTIEDDGDIGGWLASAGEVRRAMAPPVVAVRIALADRPGEIAQVGRALAATGVDVRDLQLRHAPHGGGGVLTISVRPGESEPLRAALTSEGLLLVD